MQLLVSTLDGQGLQALLMAGQGTLRTRRGENGRVKNDITQARKFRWLVKFFGVFKGESRQENLLACDCIEPMPWNVPNSHTVLLWLSPPSLCQPESLKLIKWETPFPFWFFFFGPFTFFKVSNKYEKKLDMKYMWGGCRDEGGDKRASVFTAHS